MSPADMAPLRQPHHLSGTLVVLATIALAACNSLTGADELVLYGTNGNDGEGAAAGHGDGDGDGDGDGNGDGDTGSGGAGSGPATPTGGQGGSTSSGHTGGDPTTTTSTSSTTTTTSTSSGGPVEPVDCVYPDSGYGVYEGDVVPGNLAWQGYAEDAAQAAPISIQDYLDCDGSKGIHALLIVTSATWCGACQQEASDLPSHAATFAQKGIRVLTLMVQNANGQPASLATATSWRNTFGLEDFATAADPNFSFAGSGNVGLPLQVLVDPRTMTIVDRSEGFGGYSAVTQLADQNAALAN